MGIHKDGVFKRALILYPPPVACLPRRLTYWVVYALFTVLEVCRNLLPSFWYSMKLGILVWAMLPQTQGAEFIYSNFLKDFISGAEKIGTGDVHIAVVPVSSRHFIDDLFFSNEYYGPIFALPPPHSFLQRERLRRTPNVIVCVL